MMSVSSSGKQTNVTRTITFCNSTVGGDQIGEYDMARTCVKSRLCMPERKGYLRSTCRFCGPGSSVGIATGYGLDGPGIEFRWGARFSAPVQTGLGAHPATCTMGTGSFLGGKERSGRDADPSPLLVPLVMKE